MEPKLRFKEFSGDWEEKKLSKETYIKGRIGWKNLKAEEYTDEGPYLIAGKHINNGIIDWQSCDHISNERYEESMEIALKINDVIISKDGTLGNPALITELPDKATINGTMMLLRMDEKIDKVNSKYFYHILNSKYFFKLLKTLKSGGTVPHIFQRDIIDFKFPITSIPEQTKIADFLSTVDEKIQNQQDKITHLENIKNGFMQKIFSRKIRFKDANGNEFPEWEEKRLKNYIEIITGYPFDSEKFIEENNNNPIIRIRDLQNNKISLFTTENYDLKYKVYKDDILIGMDGDFYITMWKGIEVGLNQRIMKINPKKELIKNNFLYYLLIPAVKYINDITPFTTVKHLSSKDILNLKVQIPCLKEQQKIGDFLSSFDDKIDDEKETLEHLKELKKGLLQQMFV